MQEREDKSPSDGQDSLAADHAADPVPAQDSHPERCPQCGSSRIRRRSRALRINLIACAVSLPVAMMLCAAGPVVLTAFLALPVTTAIALTGRNRCLGCGHRFEPGGGTAAPRFPWCLHTLNVLVLLLLCIVGPYVMRFRAGAKVNGLPDMMTDLYMFFMFGLFLWGSLAWHLVLHRLLKRRIVNLFIWAVLFLLPGVLGGGRVFYLTLPRSQIRALLTYARLAPLPEAATGVRFYTWSTPFSGENFIRFTADPNDIERFLAESPALQRQEPVRYSALRMRLEAQDYSPRTGLLEDGNENVQPKRTAPSWHKQEFRGPARMYHAQPPRYQSPGTLLVDDETHTVHIYTSFD